MTESPETKTCGMCCMEIPAGARKCPYCQQFQNKLAMVVFHPAFLVLFIIVPMVAALIVVGTMFQRTFDRGEDFQVYSNEITVAGTTLKFGENESGPTVAVVGRVRNERQKLYHRRDRSKQRI